MSFQKEVDGVVVTVYPPTMTGRKLRKQLGIPAIKSRRVLSDRTWRVSAKFKGIKKSKRLSFLKAMLKKSDERLTLVEISRRRGQFNSHKITSLPISEKAICFCCTNPAVLRHHVIPLSHGGRNKRNNIVPLCNDCHANVHPHLRGTKKHNVGLASRHCVKPESNGPLCFTPEDEKIRFVATSV